MAKIFAKHRPTAAAVGSQELRVLHEAVEFRRLAALAWDEGTIYPGSEHVDGSPAGHCGVTNFGFGIWLDWRGIVPARDMQYEEGRIVDANGSSVGEHHAALRMVVDDGCQHPDLAMRFDLTGDQFPGIEVPEVVQHEDYFYPDPRTPSGNRVYIADRVTPLLEYDVTRFNARLGRFVSNICNAADPSSLPSRPEDLLRAWHLAS